MPHRFPATVAGLLLVAFAAGAQSPPETPDHNALFDRVRVDLGNVHSSSLPFTSDRSRVSFAEMQVNECQGAINRDRYDRRLFDRTVAAIQQLAGLNRLSDQNRGYLSDDIRDLGRLQARLEAGY